MIRMIKVALVVAVLTFAFGQAAQANTIGTLTLSNCGSGGSGCPAATYSFNISNTSATLTITIAPNAVLTSGKNGNDLIGGVNLGFIPSGQIHVTGGTTTAAGSWTFTTGSLNNNGCGTNSGAFVCAVFVPASSGTPLVQGGTYSWTWHYTLPAGATILTAGNVHVGANYNPANGLIVSQTGALAPVPTPVPEPGSLVLLGSGLIGFAGIFRYKLMR